ncbi:MAG: M17 family peptidase N-terminal domain-containing protein [Myxococcota bacterium]
MTLLAVASTSIERVRGDLVVIPLFSDERPLRAAAGRVDWRLCGHLSRLFADGTLSGEAGEAVLIPGGGGLRAPRVMGLGVGTRRALADSAAWTAWAKDALGRSQRLGARRIALALPECREAVAERLQELAAVLSEETASELWICLEGADQISGNAWLDRTARRGRFPQLEIQPLPEGRIPPGSSLRSRAGAPDARSSHASADRFTR